MSMTQFSKVLQNPKSHKTHTLPPSLSPGTLASCSLGLYLIHCVCLFFCFLSFTFNLIIRTLFGKVSTKLGKCCLEWKCFLPVTMVNMRSFWSSACTFFCLRSSVRRRLWTFGRHWRPTLSSSYRTDPSLPEQGYFTAFPAKKVYLRFPLHPKQSKSRHGASPLRDEFPSKTSKEASFISRWQNQSPKYYRHG